MHSTNASTTAYHSYFNTTTGATVTSASPTYQQPISAVSSESKDGSGCARWSKPQFDRGSGVGVDRGANKRYSSLERLHLTSDTETELTNNAATTASKVITATTTSAKYFKSLPAKNYCLSNDKDNISKNEVNFIGNHDINDKGLCDINLNFAAKSSFQFYQTKSKRKTFLKNDFKTATTNFFQRSNSTSHYLPLPPPSSSLSTKLTTPSTTKNVFSCPKLKKGPKRRTRLRSRKLKILPKLIQNPRSRCHNSLTNSSSLLFRLRPDQLWSQTFGHCRNENNLNRRCSKKYSYYYYNLFYYPTKVAVAESTTTDNNNKLDKFDDKKRWNVAEDCQRTVFDRIENKDEDEEDEEEEEEEENDEDQEDCKKLLDNCRSSFRRNTNSIQRSTSCDNCINSKSSLPSLFTSSSLRHDHHHPSHNHNHHLQHPYHPYSRPHNGASTCCPTTTTIESQLNQPLIHPTSTVANSTNLLLSRTGINRPSPNYSNIQFQQHNQNPYQRYQSSKYCPLLLPHCHCHHLNRCISDSQSIETNLSGSLDNSIASSLVFVDPNNQNKANSPNDPNSLSLSSSSEEDEEDHHRYQNFSCLSTIMEILPLVLLLTMGVIISTTCAKYTFHSNSGSSSTSASSSQSGPYSSAISSSMHTNNGSVLDYSNGPHHYHHHSSSHQYPYVNHHNLESSGTSSDSERSQMQNDDEYSSSSSSSSSSSQHAQPQSASHHKSPQSASSSTTIDLISSGDSTLDSSETNDDQSRTPKSSKPSYRSTYQSTGQSALSKSQHSANTPQQQQQLLAQFASQVRRQYSVMRLRWLSNSSVTCNDGTRAGYYVRHSPNSRRWLIYLEGGWYCVNKASCDQRWSKMREFMTSFRWAEYKTFNGILSASSTTNPHWWDANHVFIPYCSSDIWSGDSAPPNEMAFLGSRIIDEVIKELTRSPVYRFTDAKLVLLAGSSAGAAGVMINLDRVARMIGESGSKADVRGLADSGWILESDYFESQQQPTPHQYGNKMPCIDSVHCSPMESIKGAFKMWKSRVPNSCVEQYPHEPWRCYFGYRLYPTLRTPLFVVQYQYDEFQIHMDGMNGRPLNEHEKMQYIRSLSEQIRITLTNVSAVFAPSCISHIMLTKPDWHKVSIRGVTLPDALNCWEQNPGAGNHHPSIGGSQSPLYRSSYHHQNQPPKSSMSSILNTRYQQLYHKLASLQNHQNQQHNPFQSSNNNNNNNQYPGYKGSLPSYSIPIESISDNDEIVIDNSGDGSSDINGKNNEEISNPYHHSHQTRPEDELSQFYSSNTGQISARYNSAQNLRSLSTHDLGVLLPPSSESIDFRQTNASTLAAASSTGLGTSTSSVNTFYNSLLKSDGTVELGLMDEPKKISVYQHVPDLVTESSSRLGTSSVSSSLSSVPEVDTTHHNRHTHHHKHNKHSSKSTSSSSSAPSVVSTFESQPGFKETNDLIIENFQPPSSSSSKLFNNNNNNNVISTTTSTTTATAASAAGGGLANVSSMLNLTNPVTGKVHQSHNNKKRKKRKRRKNQRRQHQQQQSNNNNNSTNSQFGKSKSQNNHQNNPNKRIHLDSGTSRFSNSKTNNRNPAHNSHNHHHHHQNQHQQQQNQNQQSQNSRNRGFTGIGSNPYHLISSSDWIESSGQRQCDYRLIDDHSFPKRNFDCPRFYKAYMD